MVLSSWSCSYLQVTLPQTDAEARDVVSWPFPCNCVVPFLLHAKLPRQNSQSGTGPDCSDASACNRGGLRTSGFADTCWPLPPADLPSVPIRCPCTGTWHVSLSSHCQTQQITARARLPGACFPLCPSSHQTSQKAVLTYLWLCRAAPPFRSKLNFFVLPFCPVWEGLSWCGSILVLLCLVRDIQLLPSVDLVSISGSRMRSCILEVVQLWVLNRSLKSTEVMQK